MQSLEQVDYYRASLTLVERRVLQAQDQQCRQAICEHLGIERWSEITPEQLRDYTLRSDLEQYVIDYRARGRSRKDKLASSNETVSSVCFPKTTLQTIVPPQSYVASIHFASNATE